jgi:type I restriction enzyme S subunit
MRNSRENHTISDIADVQGGGTPSTKDPSNFGGDIPWLTPKDLAGSHNRYIARGELNLSQKGLRESSAKLLPTNSVLVSSRAPIGYVAIAKNPIATNQGFRNLVLKPGFDPEYVYYWLTAHVSDLERLANGSTFMELSGSSLKQIAISTPSFPEQRAIAHILGTLDDKIELNRRMNETLEAMARALFKSWFIDFDPVHAKAEDRDPGLPAGVAALFPDSFQDSDLGEVPEGWAVRSLGELIKTVKGCSYKSDDLVDSDTALVTLKSFARGGGYRLDGLKSFAGSYRPEQVATPGELVIACTDVTQAAGVIGRTAVVRGTRAYRVLVASLDTLIVRPNSQDMTRSFLYFLGRTDDFVAHTYSHTTGTTVLHLAKEAVPSFAFALPPARLVREFDLLANPVLNRIQAADEQSETIAALRDTLLPKLLSGGLRVKDVEEMMEAHV